MRLRKEASRNIHRQQYTPPEIMWADATERYDLTMNTHDRYH